jgi:hypothetical protein
MNRRRPAEEITQGLETTSAKIRALAQAGYDRTEIHKQLGIRYQHVRKVLLDAGIEGGLRRQANMVREPVAIDVEATLRRPTPMDVLTSAGFRLIGDWVRDSEGALRLQAKAPAAPGVYAFVVDDSVVYVGLTLNGLKVRFDQYRAGHKGQKTSARINGLIAKALATGKQVRVLVATPDDSRWNDLPVNTAAGLEAGLIKMIGPVWNITGVA